jgi:nicotinate-nucleotide adenylyltransferase
MERQRVGFFGGTFDPPHLGHTILAQEVCYQLNLDSLYWLITPDPPHKLGPSITPVHHRLEMVERIVDRVSYFMISRLDLDRPAPHYAVESVELARKLNPDSELIYLMGEDSLLDLPDWHSPVQFLAAVDQLAVAPRPGAEAKLGEIEPRLPGIGQKTVFLQDVMIEISSSVIRNRIRSGAPYRHFLDDQVADYLLEQKLYLD